MSDQIWAVVYRPLNYYRLQLDIVEAALRDSVLQARSRDGLSWRSALTLAYRRNIYQVIGGESLCLVFFGSLMVIVLAYSGNFPKIHSPLHFCLLSVVASWICSTASILASAFLEKLNVIGRLNYILGALIAGSATSFFAFFVNLNFPIFAMHFWEVTSMVLAFCLIWAIPFSMRHGTEFFVKQPEMYGVSEELRKLIPKSVRGEIVYLKAMQHYVFIRTENGTATVRIRFKDAIKCLPASAGKQVHRSFWVANGYLDKPSRKGRRWTLEVLGDEISVSPSFFDQTA